MAARKPFRVVSYNVLSSSLCSSEDFVHCGPADCDSNRRYERVFAKVDREMGRRAVICLQEVSHEWYGRLCAHFARRDYFVVSSNYSSKFTGFMGVLVAAPRECYLVDTFVQCVATTKKTKPPPTRVSVCESGRRRLYELVYGPGEMDSWKYAMTRSNAVVGVVLRINGNHAVVATYHMPCAFNDPPVMTAHAALVAQYVQSKGMPYVLAGDFNFKPNSPYYSMYTRGVLMDKVEDMTEKTYGKASFVEHFPGDTWTPSCKRMKSAYAEQGGEPPYTNHAKKKDGAFTGCLDYLFYDGLTCVSVDKLPDAPGCASYPSSTEPSDHLMVAAEFS